MTSRTKILVIATTFPQSTNNLQPRFVIDLCKSVKPLFQQRVIVPSGRDMAHQEIVEGLHVRRFRYFFKRNETLAYASGIMANLKSRPLRWTLLPFFTIGMVIETVRQLWNYKPDLIHAHWWFPAGLAAVIALKLMRSDCPLLVTCHGGDYYVVGKKFPRLMRWVLRYASAIAMVSTAMITDAKSSEICAEKIFLGPMGVDLNGTFTASNSARTGVVYVGRLVRKKGVDVLVRAWSLCSDTVRRNGLTIIGGGEQEHFLKLLATELGISDTIRFIGPTSHDELPEILHSAKLLVFPSIVAEDNDQEGLGLVPIEAMGCGCPVLASDIPSLHDVIDDGVNGEFFRMGSKHVLANSLTELISNQARLQQYSQNGRDSVLKRYDWRCVGKTYSNMYQQLISEV